MRVLVLGDSHGHLGTVLRACHDAVERWNIGAALQVGDFGLLPKVVHEFLIAGHRRFPVPLHVIDGNHEDHRWLHESRASGQLDALAQSTNLVVHRRGDVVDLDGSRVGLIGGALHADRRQEYAGQWAPDSSTRGLRIPRNPARANWVMHGDVDRALTAFTAGELGAIVSHSCPAGIGVGMQGDVALIEHAARFIDAAGFSGGPFHDCGEPGLTRLWQRLARRPPLWIFGHFHRLRECTVGATRFVCVGSTDESDGVRGVRPVLFDTRECSLEIFTDVRLGLR